MPDTERTLYIGIIPAVPSTPQKHTSKVFHHHDLTKGIEEIQMEGLTWGKARFWDVHAGIKEIQILCTIKPELQPRKITDAIYSKFPDYVRYVDVYTDLNEASLYRDTPCDWNKTFRLPKNVIDESNNLKLSFII